MVARAVWWIVIGLSCVAGLGQDVQKFVAQVERIAPGLLAENQVPGVAVAILRDGQVVFAKGFGYADRENRQGVTVDSGFNIGSISKTVAAWGLLKLVEDGKVDLDKPVSEYLTRWKLPPSEFSSQAVTLRRLLSHTAGLSLHGYPGFGPNDELPSIEKSLSGETNGSEDVRLIMEPGTQWKYSGGGYTLAQLLVEEVTGRPFAKYMRDAILRPLGMNNSDYELTPSILAKSATAYDDWGGITPNPRFTAQAAAGLHTTLNDMAKFAAAALPGPNGEVIGRGVLKPATVALMMEPVKPSSDYGLGYGVEPLGDIGIEAGHGGSNRGWQARFSVVPATGDGLIVLTNGSNGWSVLSQIHCAWRAWLTAQEPACQKAVDIPMRAFLKNNDLKGAIDLFRQAREEGSGLYVVSEGRINNLGYQLLARDQIDAAIAIFKLNVEAFPEGFNTYDSLGEAYMLKGERELAITNYKKSLALNPENTNATAMIEKLMAMPTD